MRRPFLEVVIRSPTYIDMANVMLNHPEYCYYNPVAGMQNTSDKSDEATSHPIERVPSRFGAAAGREIVDIDLHTFEHKAVDDNAALVLGGGRYREGTH